MLTTVPVDLKEAGRDDSDGIQRLASRVWPAGWHPGGLGWALARGGLAEEVVVARHSGEVVGWASRGGHHDGELHGQVNPGRIDAADVLLEWALAGQAGTEQQLIVFDGSVEMTMAANEAGLQRRGRAAWAGLFLDARLGNDDPRRAVPGYELRATMDSEVDARVAVHRDAWRPASIPYADGRAVDPAAESSFTADVYSTIRATWLYDPSFDIVAVDSAGELAASCIAWFDASTGVAEIEPLGVAPAHRRRGLAVALCLEVAALVAARGGGLIFINGTPDPAYPAPSAAYMKAGFRLLERATTFTR